MLKGIDISHHQKGLDLSKIDCDFVIIKATEGVGYVDECCDGFFQQALKLGKKVGFYHFARPVNDAVKEAQFFYENTKNYFNHAIPVLDWEAENRWNVAWAKAWLDEVYRLSGVKPMIYMSLTVMVNYDWTPVVNGDYGLWLAYYGKNPASFDYNNKWAVKPVPKWWSFIRMWQWTSQGYLKGWKDNLDCNIFYGDEVAWDKYAGAKDETPVKPEPVSEPTPEPEPDDEFSDEEKSLIMKIIRFLIKILGGTDK